MNRSWGYYIHEDTKTCETIFEDGAKLVAAPVYDEESIARAKALGYKGDDPVWQMTRHHDYVHQLLAEAEGKPYSPTLWRVAHSIPATPEEEIETHLEECRVFLIQRILNEGI